MLNILWEWRGIVWAQTPWVHSQMGRFLTGLLTATVLNPIPVLYRFNRMKEDILKQALWSCIETAIWTFNPLVSVEVQNMEKNPGMFSSKTLISFKMNRERTYWMTSSRLPLYYSEIRALELSNTLSPQYNLFTPHANKALSLLEAHIVDTYTVPAQSELTGDWWTNLAENSQQLCLNTPSLCSTDSV